MERGNPGVLELCLTSLQFIGEKLTHLEERADRLGASIADTSRHITAVMQQSEDQAGTEAYVERRLRPLMEHWGCRLAGLFGAGLEESLAQLEPAAH